MSGRLKSALLTSLPHPLNTLKLTSCRPVRIVNVASDAHYFGRLDFNNLMLERPGTYQPWLAYGNSKLVRSLHHTSPPCALSCPLEISSEHPSFPPTEMTLHRRPGPSQANILFTYELAKRLSVHPSITTNCLMPGVVNTDLGRCVRRWRARAKGGFASAILTPPLPLPLQVHVCRGRVLLVGRAGHLCCLCIPQDARARGRDQRVLRLVAGGRQRERKVLFRLQVSGRPCGGWRDQ